jgi:hypothetical protein
MPVTIVCPNCDDRREVPDDVEGKKVRCKKCGETFRARPVEEDVGDDRRAARSASKSRPRPAADDADEDERPARRTGKASRRREEDDEPDRDEGEPRRRSREEDDEADEPRPRKKKGRKAKKGGPPVVLLVSIGVGVLVVILLLIGIFSGEREPDGSAAPGGPMSGPAADGGAAGDTAVPGWLEFDDPNGQFKVRVPRMPGAPTKQQFPLASGDPAEWTIYTVEIGGGLYVVAHVVVPGREAGAPADPVLDDTISGGIGWFKGAVIKSQTKITHQKFPARQAVLEYPGVKGSTVVRVILAGNRMFWVLARGDGFKADTPKVQGFLDSLKIN